MYHSQYLQVEMLYKMFHVTSVLGKSLRDSNQASVVAVPGQSGLKLNFVQMFLIANQLLHLLCVESQHLAETMYLLYSHLSSSMLE